MAASFFQRQLATYASYHRDGRNRATHFIGIPLIVFSLFIPLAWLRFELGGYTISVGLLVGLAALALWIKLDWAIGLAMVLVLVPMWYLGERIAAMGMTTGWIVFALAFVGGWVFQLVGHVFEGKRPALVDNLFQALIGPMFLMAEIFVWLGLRRHETIAGAH
jgi:uncharacterized membrane protein YGL010W